MNKSVFLNLILQQKPISQTETEALEALAENFPFCQTAHLLLAKAAYDQGSMLSNQKLRRAAAYATNRQLLKKLIYTTTATVTLQPVLADTEHAVISAKQPVEEIPTLAEAQAPEPEIVTKEIPEVEEPIIPENKELTEPEVSEIVVSDEIPLTAAEVAARALTELETEVIAEEGTDTEAEKVNDEMPLTAAEATANALAELELIPDTTEISEPAIANVNQESVDEELARLLVIDQILHDPDLFAAKTNVVPEVEKSKIEDSESFVPEKDTFEPHPDLETLSDFDQYLFKPEREHGHTEPEEDLQVSYPEDIGQKIYQVDSLGYWMNSSRMGECLQLKDEWTTHQEPFDFHPELLLEYNKEHPVTKTLEPSDSILSQQLDIIDQFLKQNPRLKNMANAKNIRTEPMEDLAMKSTKIKKDMASENLAHIFMQQGKIKKAIKIYEHLILKIPKKKPYFVAQIEKLQNTL